MTTTHKPLEINHDEIDLEYDEIYDQMVKPVLKRQEQDDKIQKKQEALVNEPSTKKPVTKKPVAKKASNSKKMNKHDELENCLNERLKSGFNFGLYLKCIAEYQGDVKPTTAWPNADEENRKPAAKGTAKKASYSRYGNGYGYGDDADNGYNGDVIQFYDKASDIVQFI